MVISVRQMADSGLMNGDERNYFLEAHEAAEAHLGACYAALHAEDDVLDEDGPLPESPASAPFCACETCEVREILFAAWPILREAALAGTPVEG
jgi:hypothetical protein